MDNSDGQRLGLAPIRLTDKPVFDRVFQALNQPISDYTFSNTFIWGSSLALYWRQIDNHLCVFANGSGDLTLLMPPMPVPGATDADHADCVRTCFDLMDEYNAARGHRERSRIEYVSDELMERLSAVRGLNLSTAPFSGDYVYDTAKMVSLEGGSLKPKRRDRSRFQRENPDHRTEPLRDEYVDACLALLHGWQDHGDESHLGEVNDDHVGSDVLRAKDTAACELALQTYRELGLTGMVLMVGDKLVGFTLGERLSPSQCSIVIEKCDVAYHGAPQFIFSEFCRLYWADYPETNVGDDWGIPSLKFTKTSYRPTRLLSKHTVTVARPVVAGSLNRYDIPLANPPHALSGVVDPPASAVPAAGELTIRPAVEADVDAIDALERACFDHPEESLKRRQIRYLLGAARSQVQVAEVDGRVIAYGIGLVRRHRQSETGRVYAVAVHPEHQGRGIGRKMVEALIDGFAQRGVARLFIEARADNTPALALYRKLGFVDLRPLPNYYGDHRHGLRLIRTRATDAAPTPVSA